MNENSKQSYHHPNLKQALIDEAIKLLDKKPYETITIRELTNLLGVSRTAVYRHFQSKEALFQAVILEGFAKLKERMEELDTNRQLNIEDKIAHIGEKYISFALEFPALYRLMFGDKLMKLREKQCDKECSEVDNAFDMLVLLVEEAQKAHIFEAGNPMELATAIWALIHGQASLLIDGHPMIQEQKEQLLQRGTKMILRGLAPATSHRP